MNEELVKKAMTIKSICEQERECDKCLIGPTKCFELVFTLIPSNCSIETLCRQMEVVESWKESLVNKNS